MTIANQIEQTLKDALDPLFLEVVDESSNHNVPKGSETHFKVTLVSDSFSEQRLISRHRIINKLLAEFLIAPIHALALHLFTEVEWQQKNNTSLKSPECRG